GLLSVANTATLIAIREWVRRAPFCLSDVYLPDVYPPPHQGRRGKRTAVLANLVVIHWAGLWIGWSPHVERVREYFRALYGSLPTMAHNAAHGEAAINTGWPQSL
ncbi:hypothetical protein FOZ63_006310, partial [Perkinsus olseni]